MITIGVVVTNTDGCIQQAGSKPEVLLKTLDIYLMFCGVLISGRAHLVGNKHGGY